MADAISSLSGGGAAAVVRPSTPPATAAPEPRVQQEPQQNKVPEVAEAAASPAQETRQLARSDDARQASQSSERDFLTRQDLSAKVASETPPASPGRIINTTA
jgi:hypothetical protein